MANEARTIADLERKYNFSSLLGLKKNIRMNEKSITKVENELVSMLNTLIINLADVLENQSEISLWFFEGIPTNSKEPCTQWETLEDHYGDIYYDQLSGYVYQFSEMGWTRNNDTNLIQAMALTNVELDTLTDHERKVYFVQPTPPYSSGDWWILEDGTLKICQIGKESGNYETNDFIVSSKYVATIATKTGETITVLKGTVTEITENYVKYTDLATGGSTIISGDNITTGNIDTDNVTIGNGNVLINEKGMHLFNGAKVIGENGLMTSYLKSKEGTVGYNLSDPGQSSSEAKKSSVVIDILIPKGFQITKAKLVGYHTPVFWGYLDGNYASHTAWGYARGLKLYKATNMYSKKVSANLFSEFVTEDTTSYEEIEGAFGTNGWTASVANETTHNTEKFESSDIKDIFIENNQTKEGLYQIKLEPKDNPTAGWGLQGVVQRSGNVILLLVIEGYMSYS